MIEFAGSLILLLLLVFGISEIGRAIYQLNTLTKSADAGVRYMSRVVGAITFNPSASSTTTQCVINDSVWSPAAQRATNIVLYGTETPGTNTRLPNMEVTSLTVTPHLDPNLSQGGACVIKISAQATFSAIFAGNTPIPSPIYSQGGIGSNGLIFTTNAEERYIGN